MHVPHDAVILVADGRKLLFLRNAGDAEHLDLQVVTAQEHPNARTTDQATDTAGRASGTHGGTMGEADFHQIEEDRFAAEAADLLRKRALVNDFSKLIVVAPARTLGELRKHYHKEVTARLVGEIGKDLTGRPIADIERALADA